MKCLGWTGLGKQTPPDKGAAKLASKQLPSKLLLLPPPCKVSPSWQLRKDNKTAQSSNN